MFIDHFLFLVHTLEDFRLVYPSSLCLLCIQKVACPKLQAALRWTCCKLCSVYEHISSIVTIKSHPFPSSLSSSKSQGFRSECMQHASNRPSKKNESLYSCVYILPSKMKQRAKFTASPPQSSLLFWTSNLLYAQQTQGIWAKQSEIVDSMN